jgi:hypothetical protein
MSGSAEAVQAGPGNGPEPLQSAPPDSGSYRAFVHPRCSVVGVRRWMIECLCGSLCGRSQFSAGDRCGFERLSVAVVTIECVFD